MVVVTAMSDQSPLYCGVPQGSVLGSVLEEASVVVGTAMLDQSPVYCGVPQSSVLGPVL